MRRIFVVVVVFLFILSSVGAEPKTDDMQKVIVVYDYSRPVQASGNSPNSMGVDAVSVRSSVANVAVSLGGNVRKNLPLVSGVAINIPLDKVDALRNSPGIKEVYMDRVNYPSRLSARQAVNADTQESILGFNGSLVRVAVIDSGIQANHSELNGSVASQQYFCAGRGTLCEDTEDYLSHGTHVAGIISGIGGFNVCSGSCGEGVAQGVQLYDAKVFYCYTGDCTSSSHYVAQDSDIIDALDWAISNDVDIISMSLGGGSYAGHCDNGILAKAVNNASINYSIAVFVAAGNDGYTANMSSPACASGAIAVGATTDADAVASFSNRNSITDIMAPGVDIFSTYSCVAAHLSNGAFLCGMGWNLHGNSHGIWNRSIAYSGE